MASTVLLGIAGPVHPLPRPGPAGALPVPRALVTSTCPGSTEPKTLDGRLEVQGNATPHPSVGSVNLTIGYAYQSAVTPSGGSTSYTCSPTAFVATTAANGSFVANFKLPPSGCNHAGCTEYTGPYRTFSVALTDTPPTGYFLNGSLTWPTSRLLLVAALQSVSFVPAGPLTVSCDAPTEVRAEGWTANGLPSPANLTFNFSVGATEWRLTDATGDAVTVLALPGAGPASLLAVANGTFEGRALDGVGSRLALAAIATNLTGASVDPTELDVGAVATFSLLGEGSEGYNYTAQLHPGLGAPTVDRTCLEGSLPGGAVRLVCTVSFTYSAVGEAQPFAVLTNGYSSATWNFPELAVHSALEVTGTPAALRGYLGSRIPVSLVVPGNSGTGPYGPACLETGLGGMMCDLSAGPTWAFAPSYNRTGSFVATGTVMDAAGSNATVELPVTISARPSVGELVASSQAPLVGEPVELSALLSGGMAPFAIWWNDSLPRSTVASSSAGAPGVLRLEYLPTTPGLHVLTVTILDGLGTVVAAEIELQVEPPAAVLGWGSGAPPVSLTAGLGAHLSLVAEGPNGTLAPSFAEPLRLEVISGPPDAPVWVNASVPGALEGLGPDAFGFNATGWYGGYLNFSLGLLRAGIYELKFVSDLPIAAAPSGMIELAVDPDLYALRLVAPHVVLGGDRTNSTLWHLVDPFGNPAPPGRLYLVESFGGSTRESTVPIDVNATSAWAWVNYTAPDPSAGSLAIVTEWNETLAVLSIPAGPAAPPLVPLGLLATGSAAALAVAVVVAVLLRRRRGLPRPAEGEEVPAEELRRQAEGRAQLLDRLRHDGPLTVEELDRAVRGAGRPEVNEWLASLVTEGLVTAERGPGGSVRFAAAGPAEGAAPARLPRPFLDPEALRRLELEFPDGPGGGPGRGPEEPGPDRP